MNWNPPAHWTRISTIDMHTGGEPLRVIVDAVITSSLDADFDLFFLHNEGYSTMCGHAIIALTKLPAGKIHARATIENSVVVGVSFLNVPSFVYLRDQQLEVPIGEAIFDIAYGGAFYALVEASQLGLRLLPEHYDQIIDYARAIKKEVMSQFSIAHPFETELSFLYGVIFTAPPVDPGHHSRNVCVFADGELDRSATGSGVSARAALHYAKGELKLNEKITIESILGSTMSVEVVESTRFGPYDAVVPEVSGTASITGRNEFYFDPRDPFRTGFICG